MSRSSYSDDYGDDFPGQLELYRANVQRSIRSKAGQARLRELRDALLALPVKELHAQVFADGTNEQPHVCALGAWALARTGSVEAAHAMVPADGDDDDTFRAVKPFGWPRLVVLDAVYFNDDEKRVYYPVEGPRRWEHEYRYGPMQQSRPETPSERYARMLAWVTEQIVAEAGAPGGEDSTP